MRVCAVKERTGGTHVPTIWFGNKWICVFLLPAPEMRWSIMENRESTVLSLSDREIELRWQKASATSITCTVLSAIITSLKAIVERFLKGTAWFYPDDWPERHLACAVIHGLRLHWFYCFFSYPSQLFPHFMRLFVSSLLADAVMNFSRFSPTVICHLAPHKRRNNNATLHLSLLIRGGTVGFGKGSGVL